MGVAIKEWLGNNFTATSCEGGRGGQKGPQNRCSLLVTMATREAEYHQATVDATAWEGFSWGKSRKKSYFYSLCRCAQGKVGECAWGSGFYARSMDYGSNMYFNNRCIFCWGRGVLELIKLRVMGSETGLLKNTN